MRYVGSFLFLVWMAMFASLSFADEVTVDTSDGRYEIYVGSYAIVIGVSNYDAHPSWENLAVVPQEVREVSSALEKQGFEVTRLLDPTYSDLDEGLREFFARNYDERTRLIVFFAGHGWTDYQRSGYVVPKDGRVEDLKDHQFLASIMSFQTIESYAELTKAKHVLFVFDSCFSGWAMRSASGYLPDKAFIRDIDQPTRQYITSGTADQRVPDDPLFYREFIRGISGAANVYFDNVVTVDELAYWLRLRVVRSGNQTPQFGRSREPRFRTGDMIFTALVAEPEPIKQVSTGTIIDVDPPTPDMQELVGMVSPVAAGETGNYRSNGRAANPLYDGIEIVYFGKLEDGTRVENALRRNNIPFVLAGSQIRGDVGVNAVACGPNVSLDALKGVLFALVRSGTPIRNVISFEKPEDKQNVLEILSLTEDFAGELTINSPILTEAEVDKLQHCPVNYREETLANEGLQAKSFTISVTFSFTEEVIVRTTETTRKVGVSTGDLFNKECQDFEFGASEGSAIVPGSARFVDITRQADSEMSIVGETRDRIVARFCAQSQMHDLFNKRTGDSFARIQYDETSIDTVEKTEAIEVSVSDTGAGFAISLPLAPNDVSGVLVAENGESLDFSSPAFEEIYDLAVEDDRLVFMPK